MYIKAILRGVELIFYMDYVEYTDNRLSVS